MFDTIRSFFTNPPKRSTSPLGAGMSDQDEPAIPAFQQAWKDGATFDDLFGSQPFTLHGSIGRSGADNHRPDVAKVETFLGDAGYYKPLTNDGPSGWHSTNLDTAIRSFQKDHGLGVDGVLKPNGPTIGKIGSLLGGSSAPAKPEVNSANAQGFWGGPNNDQPGVPDMPWPPQAPTSPIDADGGPTIPWPKPRPPVNTPNLPGGDIWEKPQPTGGNTNQSDLERLIQIMNGGNKPEAAGTPPYRPTPPRRPWDEREVNWPQTPPRNPIPDRFPGHTISEDGAKEHDDWAKLLIRDSDPSQTARMLKGAIDEHGDQGRGDVADLLGRFYQIDPAKAEILRRAVKQASGEDLPFRVAPLGEGFRELTDEEKIASAPKNPFGSAQGADRWEAGNMAEVLLGKGDYADAIKHFRTDQSATQPYLAAVHEIMADKNPMQAMKFATQMQKAGLAMAEDAPEPPAPTPPPVTQPPVTDPPQTTTPAPTQEPTPLPTPEPTRPPETTPPPTTQPPVTTPAPEPTQAPESGKDGSQPGQPSRLPVDGHVATKSIEELEREAKANNGHLNTQQDRDRGNGEQCTALIKHATGLGQTSDWKAGDKIKGPDDPPLKPGTAIATFNDKGTYGTDKGRHAAIFVGYKKENGQKGMEVLEQSEGRSVKRKFIPFGGSGKFIYQGGNYSVIKK